ncbi:MAG: stage 0 sporulation protein [Elusimicrobiota bacterium]|nr:stage 0 sporulation protein [Elusimicrobiota bacterium]
MEANMIALGVVVRKLREKIYVDSKHYDLKINDEAIVETEHGAEYAVVCESERNISAERGKPAGKVLREVTDEDRERMAENERRGKRAFNIVVDKTRELDIDLNLTCVNYIFDRTKLFVYYTSETRVDFRELIKELGHILKTRIQMVQIGVRDEARIIGGFGICGRGICCQNFLLNFNSVTMDMAKEQDLSLNAFKLSGLCGRLMCCIAYESQFYRDIKEGLPKLGSDIITPRGKAKFAAIDCIKGIVTADFGEGIFEKYPIDIIKPLNSKNILRAAD